MNMHMPMAGPVAHVFGAGGRGVAWDAGRPFRWQCMHATCRETRSGIATYQAPRISGAFFAKVRGLFPQSSDPGILGNFPAVITGFPRVSCCRNALNAVRQLPGGR